MKQLYYAIQTILHGRGSNVTKLISLSLGLTIGILLFSQIAFELSYEKCYPDAERLALARELFIDSKSGKIVGDDGDNYDYTLFAPVAAALAENLPEQIESATCIYPDNVWNLYKEVDARVLQKLDKVFVDGLGFFFPVPEWSPVRQ